jgi:hypothetical protein
MPEIRAKWQARRAITNPDYKLFEEYVLSCIEVIDRRLFAIDRSF